jgi:FkbM family methyltransferase
MSDELIFDIGMHHGEDSEFYLKKGFRVVAIEANPALCAEVGERLASWIGQGRLTIVNRALGEHPGKARFFVNDAHSEWSTLSPGLVRRREKIGAPSHAIEVPVIRPKTLFTEFGVPYYMKVDIETADWLCLADLVTLNERPRFTSVEMDGTTPFTVHRLFRLLQQAGYTRFKIISQKNVPAQAEPNPPREGQHVGHRFVQGSSGLFGADLPGDWISAREALAFGYKASLSYWMVGDEGLLRSPRLGALHRSATRVFWRGIDWYDCHATY